MLAAAGGPATCSRRRRRGDGSWLLAERGGEPGQGAAAAGRAVLASSLATVAVLTPARPASFSWDKPRSRRNCRNRPPSRTVVHDRAGCLAAGMAGTGDPSLRWRGFWLEPAHAAPARVTAWAGVSCSWYVSGVSGKGG
ncbi:MAG TPA: hypothetical protein VMV92_10010 [Streptosporangiaceae bacterium]|nr:hypothetical protein [Streptosporangiaceae bacterium]